jgi:hypothetical protein
MNHDEIYKKLLNHIFEQNEKKFMKIITKNQDLILYNYGGYYLIHYLFDNYWERGIEIYKSKKYKLDLLTEDKIMSLNGIPLYITGGQNFLHIVARKNKELYKKIKLKYDFLQIPDFNSELPEDLYYLKNNCEYCIKRYKEIVKRNEEIVKSYIKCENNVDLKIKFKETINENIIKFELDKEIILKFKNEIEQIEEKIPNSMHKYGKIIYKYMKNIINSLINELLCLDNIIDIHAYYIKYNNSLQKSLEKHKDDSTYTINLCLSNTSNESKLIFDDINYEYKHKECVGIIHSGSLYHHVEDICFGERENIIVWIKCL